MPQPHLEDESSAPKRYERRVIRPEMTVRQVSADFPACRAVFAAHGEIERAGVAFGHCQTLGDFARARGLVFDDLLDELSTAAGVAVDRWGRGADGIHRLFLLAALVITLTLGAGWGAWLLWEIGQARAFPAAAPSHIVAHGEMQLWGFVGLFIAGISLRTVLRDAVRTRARQWICRGMLSVVLLALVGGFIWSLWPNRFPHLGWIGGTWLLGASTLFWGVQIGCLADKWRMTWARAVMTSGLWLTVWAGITCWLRWQAGEAGPALYSMRERLIVIELAVFGFALNSIYGFGQMLLPGLLGLGKTRAWALESAYWCHNLGVMVLVLVGFGGLPGTATPIGVSSILAGTILFATGQNGFQGKRPRTRGLEKGHHLLDAYIPLAFFWLLTSMLLLAGVSIWEAYFGVETSHAIAGGIRHALTVGFMTTLILGVGQRIVPVLEHAIPTLPMLVAPILLLIGLGNGLRVVTEFGTLWLAEAFWVMPFSALLEWGALLLFGVSMVTQMFRRDPFLRDGRVRPTSSLALVLSNAPWLEDRLIVESSGYLARVRSVPQELTVAAFAQREQREPEEFARYLRGLLAEENHLAADPVGNPKTRVKTTATPKSH